MQSQLIRILEEFCGQMCLSGKSAEFLQNQFLTKTNEREKIKEEYYSLRMNYPGMDYPATVCTA